METQTDFGERTVATLTDDLPTRCISVCTDPVVVADQCCSTDPISCWNASCQTDVTAKDAAVDPGEWNCLTFYGVDSQTDTPDLSDPLFWFTPSIPDICRTIDTFFLTLDRVLLNSSSDTLYSKDILRIKAENVILRLELEDLRCRRFNTSRSSLSPMPTRPALPSSVETNRPASRYACYTVVNEDGVDVLSSLSLEASTALGRLMRGDKVISAGNPTQVGGSIRMAVFPRGFVTVRDSVRIYLMPS